MSTNAKVAVTAATSFTGLWICRALKGAGANVQPLSSSTGLESFSGLKRVRAQVLARDFKIQFQVRAEDGSMAKWILQNRPDFWIHHHHYMKDFRSPQYDANQADKVGMAPLEEIVHALKKSGCRGVLYSGSYFEIGPYAQSKKRVWAELNRLCLKAGLAAKQIVIPNPFGPLENEDRLIPVMIQKAKKNDVFNLSQPDNIADNIPIENLAQVYSRVILDWTDKALEFKPSGWIGRNQEWIELVNKELLQNRLGLKNLRIEVGQQDSSTVTRYQNSSAEKVDIQWPVVWDHYAHWMKEIK